MSDPKRAMAVTHPNAALYFKEKALHASLDNARRCSKFLPNQPYDLPIPLGTGEFKVIKVGAPEEAPAARDFGAGIGGPPSSKGQGASRTTSPLQRARYAR